jgi:hypothetical protein
MDIVRCLSCGATMVPMSDGRCPSCQKPWNIPPTPEEIAARLTRPPPPSFTLTIATFINGKAAIIAIVGIIVALSGMMGCSISRRGHAFSSTDSMLIGAGIFACGVILYIPTRIIIANNRRGRSR